MALLSIHHPFTFTFGILGNLISFLVYLAPVPTFYRIYRKKSTEAFQSLPYLVALFSSMLWLYYAMLKKDALLLMTINSFGCVIETIYIIMFITYAPKQNRVSTIKVLVSMNMGLFFFILLLTHFLVRGSTRVVVLGWINVAISVSVFAAPLSILAQVIRTKSVEFMPFPLSFCLTLSAIMWFSYGVFSKDPCVAVPNVVGFFLGLLQMLLYAVYRDTKKKGLEEKKLPIVILSSLGTCEVHPVDIIQPQVEEEDDDDDDTGKHHEQAKEESNDKKDEKTMHILNEIHENECAV